MELFDADGHAMTPIFRAFMLDQLPGNTMEQIIEHAEGCPHCKHRLIRSFLDLQKESGDPQSSFPNSLFLVMSLSEAVDLVGREKKGWG